MKSIKRLFAMGLAVMMALSIPFSVSAAELEDAPIDESRTGSLTIYKYDLTNAEKDGVWDSSYVSTGVFDQTGVNDVLGGSSSIWSRIVFTVVGAAALCGIPGLFSDEAE